MFGVEFLGVVGEGAVEAELEVALRREHTRRAVLDLVHDLEHVHVHFRLALKTTNEKLDSR